MPLSIAQFFDRLRESELLGAEEVEAIVAKVPEPKRAEDSDPLVRELVAAKTLTEYQATALSFGRGKTLVLGDYVVLREIGEGGMGQVLLARHVRLKRQVALKILPPSVTASAEMVKRFQREMELAAKLSHRNIVAAHDAREEKGIHYLVMEFVAGDDLNKLVKKQGPLPISTAVDYVYQAAVGLAHAHEHGVVHRDIKPANMLVDSLGTVKILDLGLARFDGHDTVNEADSLTKTGALMGTADYMAPEQALDTKHADARADVYALGCTLFYLLTGRVMYTGDTYLKRILSHREDPIPSLAAARPGVPTELVVAFEHMVAKRPEDRCPSMAAVLAALAPCLTGTAVDIPVSGDGLSSHTIAQSAPTAPTAPTAVMSAGGITLAEGPTKVIAELPPKGPENVTIPASIVPEPTPLLDASPRVASGTFAAQPPTATSVEPRPSSPVWQSKRAASGVGALPIIGAAFLLVAAIAVAIMAWNGSWWKRGAVPSGNPTAAKNNVPPDARANPAERGSPVPAGAVPEASPNTVNTKPVGELPTPVVETAKTVAQAPPGDGPKPEKPRILREPKSFENSLQMKLVYVPSGKFEMGSPESESGRQEDETLHQVVLSESYFISAHEVTQAQFETVLGRNLSQFKKVEGESTAAFPVENVSWFDAVEFCNALSKREDLPEYYALANETRKAGAITMAEVSAIGGTGYRLPSEAQWEYACRAGSSSPFHFGQSLNGSQANVNGQIPYGTTQLGPVLTRPQTVGSYPPNAFGLFDMHGNVGEWCDDAYGEYGPDAIDPKGATNSYARVVRGGNWSTSAADARAARREWLTPVFRAAGIVGFRVALPIEE